MARTNNNTAGNYFSATINWLPTNATILWRCKTSFDTALFTIIGQRSNANWGFGVHRDPTNDRIHFVTYGWTDMYSNTNSWPADGNWHTFAITKSGNSVSFYVDGVAAGTATSSGATALGAGATLALGALWYESNGPFINNMSGELAEVALFSRVLSAGELRRYYLGESPNNYSTSLDHYWKLNESSGDATATTGTTMTQTGTMGSATHPTMNYTGAVNVTAKSIGTGSRDYSTVQSWEDACFSDLTASNEIWKGECYKDSTVFLSSAISISGTTTSGSCYPWLTTGPGQGIKDNANSSTPCYYNNSLGATFCADASTVTTLLSIYDDYVTISNLQFLNDIAESPGGIVFVSAGSVVIERCIIFATTTATYTFGADGDVTLVNCLLYNTGTTPSLYNGLYNTQGLMLRNCTVVCSSSASTMVFSTNSNVGLFNSVNTAFFNFGSFKAVIDSFGGLSNYNATDLSAPTNFGANSLASLTFSAQFVSQTNDYRPVAGGSLDGSGTPDASATGGVDIFGRTRSSTAPSIGAYEYIVAPTLSTPELISLTATQATPRVYIDVP